MVGASTLAGLCLLGAVLAVTTTGPTPEPAQFINRTRGGRRGPGRHREQAVGRSIAQPSMAEVSVQQDSEPGQEEEDSPSEQLVSLLQRLSDRFTALQALDEQQLHKLESIEYRLTKLEVQTQEKHEAVRTEMRDVSRRVQQLDWQSGKIEASLEAVKSDLAGLKHGQDMLRGMHGTEMRGPNLAQEDIQNKMQMIIASIYSVRGALGVAQEDISDIKKNVSIVANTTNMISVQSQALLTARHFASAMLEARQHAAGPVSALPDPRWACAAPGNTSEALPWDCLGVQQLDNNRSGIYRVHPPQASQPFFVYCDMETQEGGWTVFQQRTEGTIDFSHGWQDYKYGFGNLGGEFWLGLEKIHLLTNYKVNELLIELEDFTLDTAFARYSAFAIGAEIEGYPISVLGKYNGTAGDSLVYHAGMKFSTHDMDQDNWEDGNCARSHGGAWWYNGCDTSNLNGRYLNGEVPENYEYQGMYWYDWHGPSYSLMKSRMMVRPRTGLYTAPRATGRSRNKTTARGTNTVHVETHSSEPTSPEHDDTGDNPLHGQVTEHDHNADNE